MKDYYKILGVEEDANGEEIRDRYVELVKLNHPDLTEPSEGGDRIREINEAYEVLKDDSTRMDYDLRLSLKRAYLKRRDREKEGRWFKKAVAFSLSILFVLLLFGLFLWKRPAVDVRPPSMAYHPIEKKIGESPVPPIPTRQPEPGPLENERTSKTSPQVRQGKPGEIKINTMTTPAASNKVIASESSPKEIEQQPRSVIEAKPEPIPVSNLPPLASKPAPPVNITLPGPPPLVEEEVKQFLSNYIDRYMRKDIQGFLSLFSLKAIQNRKDGPEKIRDIYLRFFDQSEELIYRIENIKISIHSSDAQVMGRYQVVQKLKKQRSEKLWKGNLRLVLLKEDGALKIITLDYQPDQSP